MCFLARPTAGPVGHHHGHVNTRRAPPPPALMKWLAGTYVTVDFWAMARHITEIVILPVVAGLLFHYLVRGKFKWLDQAMPYP